MTSDREPGPLLSGTCTECGLRIVARPTPELARGMGAVAPPSTEAMSAFLSLLVAQEKLCWLPAPISDLRQPCRHCRRSQLQMDVI